MYDPSSSSSTEPLKKKCAKGVPGDILANFSKNDYLKALKDLSSNSTISYRSFRIEKHKLYLMQLKKRGLISWDTKRFWPSSSHPDKKLSYSSVPYGYNPSS